MASFKVDLSNCDREPIHIPGSIQPHGALLAADPGLTTVTRYSANLADFLGLDLFGSPLLGMPVADLLGNEAGHSLRNALAISHASHRPALVFGLELYGRRFDVSVHQSGKESIVEFEPAPAEAGQPLDIGRTVIARISRSQTIESLVQSTARLMRATLGYDRVMVYRFEEDGAGQVISEARNASLESFLGQFFPASDIPQQARELYLRNTVRFIGDASGDRIPIVPEIDASGDPIDLSYAHLRSVSPIHCEYLRNMGVSASMSISIVLDGQLWGLVACHHYSPKPLTMTERIAIEMFGEFLSLHLDIIRQKERIETAKAARASLDRFLREAPSHNDFGALLRHSVGRFSDMLPSDGTGILINGSWTPSGTVPPEEAITEIATFLNEHAEGRIWATHSLMRELPEAEAYAADVSGLLAIPLSQRPRDYLFFFRKEFEHTVNWAGNPDKSYTTGVFGDRLTPRTSFAIWKQTVQGQSRRWTDVDREIAEAIRSSLVEVVMRHNEIIAEERERADLRQRMLNEELNHRVKNILAVIKSIVGQPNPEDRTLEEYLDVLRGRIDALAVAHDQIVRGEGGGFLKDLLFAELRPYRDQVAHLSLEGPPVWIDTSAFSVLALVFHELATNSAKYGALSAAEGRLAVTWTMTPDEGCELIWEETGGPPVTPPRQKGFGSVLITRSVPHDLGGESQVDYRPEGLRARFLVPRRNIAVADAEKLANASSRVEHEPAPARTAAPEGTSILLVEDQMLIAMDAEIMLADHGLTDVVTVSSVREALRILATFRPSAAILDVNLGSGTSLPIAEELKRQGIPFIFATGYGDATAIPPEFSRVTIVRKPYSAMDLVPRILELLGG